MYVYIYIYIYIYICIFVYVYIYIYIHIRIERNHQMARLFSLRALETNLSTDVAPSLWLPRKLLVSRSRARSVLHGSLYAVMDANS